MDGSLQRAEVFLKNWHASFIEPYRLTSIGISTCRSFYTNSKKVHKLPRVMCAYERMDNLIVLKGICQKV